MIVQKISTSILGGSYEMAYKYFFMQSIINNLELVKRDVQLLAYAISEGKDVSEVKKDFVKKFGSSMATVGNIITKLYKLNILEKHKRVVKINPMLLFDFSQDLELDITFKHGNKG